MLTQEEDVCSRLRITIQSYSALVNLAKDYETFRTLYNKVTVNKLVCNKHTTFFTHCTTGNITIYFEKPSMNIYSIFFCFRENAAKNLYVG